MGTDCIEPVLFLSIFADKVAQGIAGADLLGVSI